MVAAPNALLKVQPPEVGGQLTKVDIVVRLPTQ
jgi:hypothetical protein